MVEETKPQSGQTETPPPVPEASATSHGSSPKDEAPVPSRDTDRTPEDIEAYWKNRQSQEASAHAAREQALREQIATLEGAAKVTKVDEARDNAANQTEAERLRAENISLQEQMKQTQAQALTETRKAKYPFAAENIDADTLGRMDEANLAGLNEKLKPSATGGISPTAIMDANAAGRPPLSGADKPLSEKTREELMADLKVQGPAFVESFRGK